MIEIIKEETLEKKEGEFCLPKNIRQIGDAQDGTKVYIEDYVMTYLKQSAAYKREEDEVFVLYGNKMEIGGTSYYFVSGSLRVLTVNSCLYNLLFDEEDWKKINEDAVLYFPSLSVLGWALLREEDTDMFDYRIIGTHEKYFRKDQEVYLEYSKTEKEEQVYLYREGKMEKQKGHYIYYDKNDLMQNYMVSIKEEKEKVEEEHVDNAAKKFRMVVQEKKEQKRRHKTNVLLYSAATVLAFVILLIGITMLNNYEKMQNMERVLYQIASEAASDDMPDDEVQVADNEMQDAEDKSRIIGEREADEAVVETSGTPESSSAQSVSADAIVFNDPAGADTEETLQIGQQTVQEEQNNLNETKQGQNEDDAAGIPEAEQMTGDAETEQTTGNADTPDTEQTTGNADTPDTEQTTGNAETSDAEQTTNSPETTEQDDKEDQDNQNKAEEEDSDEPRQTIKTTYQTYIIRKGDTLEKINQLFYGNVNRIDEICSLNNIKNKDNICYGEKIILP